MSQIINGKEIAAKIRAEVTEEVEKFKHMGCRPPKLLVIQVGEDPASSTYVKNKKKACEECGIECQDVHLPENIAKQDVFKEIFKLQCRDEMIDGTLVQLPLPAHIDERQVLETIGPVKDVDGFTLQIYFWEFPRSKNR